MRMTVTFIGVIPYTQTADSTKTGVAFPPPDAENVTVS